MMNEAMLEEISTVKLIELRDMVAAAIKKRPDATIRRGTIVRFKARDGRDVLMVVERVNPKSLTGRQCDTCGNTMSGISAKWRVGPSYVTPVIKEASPPELNTPAYKKVVAEQQHNRALNAIRADKPSNHEVNDSW